MTEYKCFKPFQPTEEKIKFFAQKLMGEYLYLSDEDRDYDRIYKIINHYVSTPWKNVIYEIGDYDGIMVFANIVPHFKCDLIFKLWNPKRWGADFVREAKTLIQDVMKLLELVRVETSTADPRIVRMAKMVGFEIEGARDKGFLWQGQFYDDFIMGLVKEDDDGMLYGKRD